MPFFEENKQLGFKTFFVLIEPIVVIKEFVGTLITSEELLPKKAFEPTVIASFRQKVIKESFGQEEKQNQLIVEIVEGNTASFRLLQP